MCGDPSPTALGLARLPTAGSQPTDTIDPDTLAELLALGWIYVRAGLVALTGIG